MSELREQALLRLSKLPTKTLEDIALVVETADVQGDYRSEDDGTIWRDESQKTLDCLAREIRELKEQ